MSPFTPGTRVILEVNDDETCTMTVSCPCCPDIIGVLPTALVEMLGTVLPTLTETTALNQQLESAMMVFSGDPDAAEIPRPPS